MTLDNGWLKTTIEAMGFPCTLSLFQGTEKSALTVYMGEGPDQEPQSVQLWLEPQEKPSEEVNDEMALLHLFVPICLYDPCHMPDLVGFLTSVNLGLDMPGFGVNSTTHYVYYRSYSFLTASQASTILKALMGMAFVYVDAFTDSIKALANGKSTPQEAYKSILDGSNLEKR